MRKIFDEFGVEYKVSKKRFRGCKLVNFREIKLSRYKIVGRDCVYMFLFTSNIIEKSVRLVWDSVSKGLIYQRYNIII